MLNTRSFIKSLVLGSIAPTILLPRLESFKWKQSKELVWIPNPAWETAPYELRFVEFKNTTKFSQVFDIVPYQKDIVIVPRDTSEDTFTFLKRVDKNIFGRYIPVEELIPKYI